MPNVCDLFFPPQQKPGMVPPPPGEESQTFVLPPGWQSYLSPQGRRYYVNTATNGESTLGSILPQPPGVCLFGGAIFSSCLHLLVFRFFPSEINLRGCFPHWVGVGGGGLSLGWEGCLSRLGSSVEPTSTLGISWCGTVFSKSRSQKVLWSTAGLNQVEQV